MAVAVQVLYGRRYVILERVSCRFQSDETGRAVVFWYGRKVAKIRRNPLAHNKMRRIE